MRIIIDAKAYDPRLHQEVRKDLEIEIDFLTAEMVFRVDHQILFRVRRQEMQKALRIFDPF